MKMTFGLWLVGAAFVLNVSAQERPDVNYDESKIPPYTLPELLNTQSGEAITTVKQWEKIRRSELHSLFQFEMYGSISEDNVQQRFTAVNIDLNFADGLALTRRSRSRSLAANAPIKPPFMSTHRTQ